MNRFGEIEVKITSMRPGQAAPVFRTERKIAGTLIVDFNEAGAGCPGIRFKDRMEFGAHGHFNEAGAGCPGIRGHGPGGAKGSAELQ